MNHLPHHQSRSRTSLKTSLQRNLRADRVGMLDLRAACFVKPDATIQSALEQMTEIATGCALVTEDGSAAGKLLGIFTEKDFVTRVLAKGFNTAQSVGEVMSKPATVIAANATVLDAVERMDGSGCRHLPVMDEAGQPIGVLTAKTLVHYLVEYVPAKVYNLPPSTQVKQCRREGG